MRKILTALLLVLLIASPIFAAAADAYTLAFGWEAQSGVNYYRYQLDSTADDGWAVVDGSVTTFESDVVDPYVTHTFYLQSSYDGTHWSRTASLEVAPLEAPVVVEETAVVEAEPEVVLAEPVIEEVIVPVQVEESINGISVSADGTTAVVTFPAEYADYVEAYVAYVANQYPEIASALTAEVVDGALVVTYPEITDQAVLESYVGAFYASVDEFITFVNEFIAALEELEEMGGLAEVAAQYGIIYASVDLETEVGTVYIIATATDAVIVVPEGFESYGAAFVEYLAADYPELAAVVAVTVNEEGSIYFEYPELESQEALDAYVAAITEEIEEFVNLLLYPPYEGPEGVYTVASPAGDLVITARDTYATITYPEHVSEYADQLIAYANATYPDIMAYVTAENQEGQIYLTYPEIDQATIDAYAGAFAAELAVLAADLPEPPVVEEPEVAEIAPIAPVAPEAVKASAANDTAFSVLVGFSDEWNLATGVSLYPNNYKAGVALEALNLVKIGEKAGIGARLDINVIGMLANPKTPFTFNGNYSLAADTTLYGILSQRVGAALFTEGVGVGATFSKVDSFNVEGYVAATLGARFYINDTFSIGLNLNGKMNVVNNSGFHKPTWNAGSQLVFGFTF